MNVRALAAKAVKMGMTLAGNAKVAVTVKQGPTGAHDIVTDRRTTTWTSTTATQAVAWDAVEKDGKEGPAGRRKMFLLEAASLPSEPKEKDVIEEAGIAWEIEAVETDPASASYTITGYR